MAIFVFAAQTLQEAQIGAVCRVHPQPMHPAIPRNRPRFPLDFPKGKTPWSAEAAEFFRKNFPKWVDEGNEGK